MDLRENADGNTVTATFDLPGLKKEDVQIEIHNGLLTVSGECDSTSEKDEGGYAVRERRYGKFSRSIRLPQGIKVSATRRVNVRADQIFDSNQEDKIKASMEHGVLNVTFPKSAPELAPKMITIA
jgi:HSP20 family protein